MTIEERIHAKPEVVQVVLRLLAEGASDEDLEAALAKWESEFRPHGELAGFTERKLAEMMVTAARSNPRSEWNKILRERTN